MLPGFVGVAPEADGAGEDDLSGRHVGDAVSVAARAPPSAERFT